MLASIDTQNWNQRPTSLGTALSKRSLDADFEAQLRHLRQEPQEQIARPSQVRNFLITAEPGAQGEVMLTLSRPLRVTVEDYRQQGVIAFLTSNKSFSGYGSSLPEAVDELMSLLLHDYRFYQSTPDKDLTADALDCKAMLRELFAESR